MAAGRATALLALCALGVQGELHAGRAPALGGARTAWPAPLGSARAARPKARPLCLRARGGELAIARDILIISTLIIALLVAQAVQIVGTNEELLVERLGKFHRRLGPGLHFVLPGWERIAFSATLREQVLDVPPQQCITRDNAPLTADAVIYFRVIDSYATRYAVEDHIDALSNLVLTQLRNEIGQLTLDQTFGARAELNRLLMVGLEEVAAGWGLRVTRIEVKDITPSPDILSAMEMQMAAERKSARSAHAYCAHAQPLRPAARAASGLPHSHLSRPTPAWHAGWRPGPCAPPAAGAVIRAARPLGAPFPPRPHPPRAPPRPCLLTAHRRARARSRV